MYPLNESTNNDISVCVENMFYVGVLGYRSMSWLVECSNEVFSGSEHIIVCILSKEEERIACLPVSYQCTTLSSSQLFDPGSPCAIAQCRLL